MTRLEGARGYEFGSFRLDPAERLLLREGHSVALTPKAFDLLVYLVERPGRLVERQALMAALWPDAVVEEANLAYNVSAVRKALGDGHEGEQFIQTVPTRGYRFVAPVIEVSAAPAASRARTPRGLAGSLAAVLAIGMVIGGVLVWRVGRSQPPVRPVVRFEIPAATVLWPGAPALSPDGTRLAYVAGVPDGQQLYVRALDSLNAVALPRAAGARQPFFSPDGRAIGFFTGELLMKVELATGHVTKLCPVTWIERGGTWGTDNRIYFSPGPYSGISVVSADGGEPQTLTKVSPDEVAHGWPALLPGGRHLLFSRWESEVLDDAKIEVLSLESGERRIVMEGGFGARYIPTGHLLYVRSGTLMAVPFDARTLRVGGTAVKVLEGIGFGPTNGQPLFGVSPVGTLAYFAGTVIGTRTQMAWMEVPGKRRHALEAPPGFYIDPVLSPDGRRLAVAPTYGSHQDIWVTDLARGTWTRLTANPRFDGAPLWRPDDPSSILFTMARGQPYAHDLFSVPADASRAPELVYASPYAKFAASSSAASRLVAFTEIRPDTKADIWLLDLGGKPVARPFLQTAFWESTPALSPDGVWLAYESDESGRPEIYVRAVSGVGGKWQVSSGGGDRPRWSRDGRQIVYRRGTSMMAASVATRPSFSVEGPRVLFEGEFEAGGFVTPNYDIAPDGRRFLMIEPSQDPEPAPLRLVVIDNWFAELQQKLAAP
ncbi:MAG TPA: winged helix-turn-helix domain-containing protein [Vicinamibacteria bacterium]|nr:winged helix-turn-helix domain-containing protein [Vicinamibacteria bacterium]